MPYHIKTPVKLEVGDVYYKGGNNWTSTYADRKQYTSNEEAIAKADTTVTTSLGITYQPDWWKNSTVVTE